VSNRPEQQQDGGSAQQRRHCVYTLGHFHHIAAGKIGGKATCQNKDGVARRVAHLALERLSHKLRAVPVTRRWLNGRQVGECRHRKDDPTQRVVDNVVFLHRLLMIKL
jgi:hypothetical protein